MFRSYQKCNTDYLENGPKCRCNLIYTHFYSSEVAASEILEIGSGIKEYTSVFLFYMPDVFSDFIIPNAKRNARQRIAHAGISEWFFQIPLQMLQKLKAVQ